MCFLTNRVCGLTAATQGVTSPTDIHTHIHTYIRAYIHTCIHTYLHTYMHMATQGVTSPSPHPRSPPAKDANSSSSTTAFQSATPRAPQSPSRHSHQGASARPAAPRTPQSPSRPPPLAADGDATGMVPPALQSPGGGALLSSPRQAAGRRYSPALLATRDLSTERGGEGRGPRVGSPKTQVGKDLRFDAAERASSPLQGVFNPMMDPALAPRQRLSATSPGGDGAGRAGSRTRGDGHEWVLNTPSSPSDVPRA